MSGMKRQMCLLIFCVSLQLLVHVNSQDYSQYSLYWDCDKWPSEMKHSVKQFWNQDESKDDDAFVWLCPNRCQSMPYFDIKITFDYWKRTGTQQVWYVFESYVWEYIGQWFNEVYWKGNSLYRQGFSPTDLTTLPSSEDGGEAFPSSQVKNVGKCKDEAKEGNKRDHDHKCWPSEMTHLDSMFPTKEFGEKKVWEPTPVDVENCNWQSGVINPYVKPCVQAQTNIVSLKPAYKFYPGTESSTLDRRCVAVRYSEISSGGSEETERQNKIRTYWKTTPKYTKHRYTWKSLREETWGPNNQVISGWIDEHKALRDGTMATGAENKRRYEWFCYDIPWYLKDQKSSIGSDVKDSSRKYYEARLYESKCETVDCEDFVSRACWENSYSIAAASCTWAQIYQGRTDLTLPTVVGSDFADKMNVYGNGEYLITIPEGMQFLGAQQQNGKYNIGLTTTFTIKLKDEFSCNRCEDGLEVRGIVPDYRTKAQNEVVKCEPCKAYQRVVNYMCETCVSLHTVRALTNRASCVPCADNTPMRRVVDEVCTQCEVMQYFNGKDAEGCLRLESVMDVLVNQMIQGSDKIFADGAVRLIKKKHYRVVWPFRMWRVAVEEYACDYSMTAVAGTSELYYRRLCGHDEIKREQQALLQVANRNETYLYKTDTTNSGFASISSLCKPGTLQPSYSGAFDLKCRDNRSTEVNIRVLREGYTRKCTKCVGAMYTLNCWPTYNTAMLKEEQEYFGNINLASSPGKCENCASHCTDDNYYMNPEEFSCMWNSTSKRRVLGVLSGLSSSNFNYWYKQAPCQPCVDVELNATHALLIKECGNKRTYRMWDALQTKQISKDDRSIPIVQTCCSKSKSNGEKCTLDEDKAEIWIGNNCEVKNAMEDLQPVKETYCPSGWYVDESCATNAENKQKWAPDCCKRCSVCLGSMFKTENYATCTGATYIDTQRNGCERSCLSNSYKKNGNCYRCEYCSTTGTGEHSLEVV